MTAGRNREQGAVLIMSLVFLALLAVIASVAATQGRTSASIALNHAQNAKAQGLADAGFQLAVRYLTQKQFRTPNWIWPENGTPVDWVIDDGNVTVSIQDEAGKIDLNTAGIPLLEALFSSLGETQDRSQTLSAAITDWRDSDHFRNLGGAEDSDYAKAKMPEAKDAPFESVDELIYVLGMDANLYARVKDIFTVYTNAPNLYVAHAPLQLSTLLQNAEQETSLRQLIALQSSSRTGELYTVISRGFGQNGATFIRKAVIELTGELIPLYGLRVWQQGSRNDWKMPPSLSGLSLVDNASSSSFSEQPKGTLFGDETAPALY